jgi:hypothetical protein
VASKLTDTTSEIICQHVRQNMVPPPVAAQSIGITYRTFQTWMKSGASDDWTGKDTRHARFYREVCMASSDAQIKAQKRLLKSVDRVESDNLKWMLERWDSDTWGRQVTIKVQNEIRHEMAIELLGEVNEILDVESYSRVQSRLLEEGSSGKKTAAH